MLFDALVVVLTLWVWAFRWVCEKELWIIMRYEVSMGRQSLDQPI